MHRECTELVVFHDSDSAGDPKDRRSTKGYCYKISDDSTVIRWSSLEQQRVVFSSIEAECMSVSLASLECIYLLSLLRVYFTLRSRWSWFPPQWQPGADRVCSKPNHTRSKQKHVDIRHYFVRDLVEREIIQWQSVPTEEKIANKLTEAFAGSKFYQFRYDFFGQPVQHHWEGVLTINETVHLLICWQTCWTR